MLLLSTLKVIIQTLWWVAVGSYALVLIRLEVVRALDQIFSIYLLRRKELLDDLEKRIMAANKVVRIDPNAN